MLDVPARKEAARWGKGDFLVAKIRYVLKDPLKATVQAEYQHVIDWGDFRGKRLHAWDRPKNRSPGPRFVPISPYEENLIE